MSYETMSNVDLRTELRTEWNERRRTYTTEIYTTDASIGGHLRDNVTYQSQLNYTLGRNPTNPNYL